MYVCMYVCACVCMSRQPFIRSTSHLAGVLPRTQGSAVSSVKWFGRAVLEKTANDRTILNRHRTATALHCTGRCVARGPQEVQCRQFSKKTTSSDTGGIWRQRWRAIPTANLYLCLWSVCVRVCVCVCVCVCVWWLAASPGPD